MKTRFAGACLCGQCVAMLSVHEPTVEHKAKQEVAAISAQREAWLAAYQW